MIRKISVVALGSLMLSGCFNVQTSQAPIATTYPYSEQQKMQAAHHWDVLAQHQATLLMENELLLARPLYVSEAQGNSDFNRAFSNLLTSQLVGKGAHVQAHERNAATVSYTVQVVEHKDRGFIRKPYGAWTTLAAGIAVATIPYNQWNEPALALIPAAAAVDIFSGSWTSGSDHEVIITTQVTENGRIIHSSSNMYYINGGDRDHYESRNESRYSAPAKVIKVTDTW